ncbi:MAG: hypothetical protein [Microviridae sp.]|nr:MAG: hypothetical protein [Microviridae sp.]
MSNTLIFLILLIKGLSNETPTNVTQIQQTVIHPWCDADPQEKCHRESHARRDPPVTNDLLSPSTRVSESGHYENREAEINF